MSSTPPNFVELSELGVVRVHGADTVRFLQGQLSNDLERLSETQSLLAGYHTPQGRTIALLRLLAVGEHELIAIVPRALAPTVAGRLRKYVLRAKVVIDDASARWRVLGAAGPEVSSAAPAALNGQARIAAAHWVRITDSPARWIVAGPVGADAGVLDAPAGAAGSPSAAVAGDQPATAWRAADIACGLAQVYAATTEEFVAQNLNLDLIGAIAFDKGCYTGQEIIARAHYRGRVKRRMQRFRTYHAVPLRPGDAGRLADGRAFKVVDAVHHPDGGCEFLAVAAFGSREQAEPAREDDTDGAAVQPGTLDAAQLPLPYALPD